MDAKICNHCGRSLVPELPHCPHCGEDSGFPVPTELRCECGFLLCKLTATEIEIKCRRCRRMVYLPLSELPERFQRPKKSGPLPRRLPEENHSARRVNYKRLPCSVCGQHKTNVLYGKCLDCRTAAIKVQYKSRLR